MIQATRHQSVLVACVCRISVGGRCPSDSLNGLWAAVQRQVIMPALHKAGAGYIRAVRHRQLHHTDGDTCPFAARHDAQPIK